MIHQLLVCRTLSSQNTLVHQRIYSRHISCLSVNSLNLKLLVSQSKLSEIKNDTLFEMSFDFEISRVDCISKENYYSHFKKNISQSLKNPPLHPLFSAEKTLSARSTPMKLIYRNRNILLPSIQLIIHSITHVDHLTWRTALNG